MHDPSPATHACPMCAGRGSLDGVDPDMVLFFGCWPGEKGHYTYRRNGVTDYRAPTFDGAKYLPHMGQKNMYRTEDQPQGYARVSWHTLHGVNWTVVSAWDRTVDGRGGCNAAFAAPVRTTGELLLAAAERAFPLKWAQLEGAGGIRIEERG